MLGPKVDGAWALHRLTTRHPVDVFALFSSSAARVGGPGQAAYAAANAALDALARQRRAAGLAGLSVGFGLRR